MLDTENKHTTNRGALNRLLTADTGIFSRALAEGKMKKCSTVMFNCQCHCGKSFRLIFPRGWREKKRVCYNRKKKTNVPSRDDKDKMNYSEIAFWMIKI